MSAQTVAKATHQPKPAAKAANRRLKASLLAMTIPFFALVILFNYVPLLGWAIVFFDYFPGKSLLAHDPVGWKHFIRMATDETFLRALRNTLVLSFLGLVIAPAPMILALLLNEVKSLPFRKFVQTLSSFPNFISWIIVYYVFFSFFSVDDGLLNSMLLKLGWIGQPTDILANSSAAWVFQTLVGLWKGVGWGAIIYLAALSGIDQELYEAARVDGAGRLREAWHISLPGMMPTFVVLFVLGIGNLLSGAGFEQIFTFMNPMVKDHLEIIDTYVYFNGLQSLNFSYATAIGVARSIVSIALLVLANYVSRLATGRSIL